MRLKLFASLLVVGVAGLFLSACNDDEAPVVKTGFSADQKKDIGEIVRKTLLARPEILQEAFAALEKRDREAKAQRKLSALSSSADTLFRSPTSPVAGNAKGDVTVVEFFDYNCPYCRKAFKGLEKVMGDDKNLRVVFKEFPIFGGASQVAAKAALAAKKQGKYFQFHKALLGSDSRVTEAIVFRRAKEIGLDVEQLKKDMNSPEIAREITETRKLAGRLDISGTPAFYVGDKFIGGAPRNLVEVIEGHAADIRKNGCKIC